MPKNGNVSVKQADDAEPIAVEIIAQDIQRIADAMRKINETRLTRHAIVILIQAKSGLPRTTIEIVLNNLDQLAANWLKPVRK
jgi:hypothetical protein